jgi:uncharacterized protein YdbL (DUF1318 family)
VNAGRRLAEPDTPDPAWLLVTVSTAGGTGSLRVLVWRKLRSLGALYLQSSVCLLPARPELAREVRQLAERVVRDGGGARVLTVAVTEPAEQQRLVAELNDARDQEYREVLERVPAFLDELATERTKGRATYAEVEESEADLDRFRAWLGKIEARDYFGAPAGAAARDAVAGCVRELDAFEAEALAAEAPPAPGPHLRALPAPPATGAAATAAAAAARRS